MCVVCEIVFKANHKEIEEEKSVCLLFVKKCQVFCVFVGKTLQLH